MIELEVTATEYGLIVKQGSMTWQAMSVEELFRGHEPKPGARFKITIIPLDQGVEGGEIGAGERGFSGE